MAKKYAVVFDGIDGRDKIESDNLAEIARYVRGQDMGPEYRRPYGLQGEYGFFIFDGFGWSDILDGREYKAELLAAPRKLRWTKREIHSRYLDDPHRYVMIHTAREAGREVGGVYEDASGRYIPHIGQCAIDYFPPAGSLAEAKAVVAKNLRD